ncbi:MAG: metallophosphoesterase family protein [Bacillota bacterium]|nr:metallophosphoesterase family protein [Bacillota bacterium]HHU60952.1 hypothetical protein [Natronincola sp.]
MEQLEKNRMKYLPILFVFLGIFLFIVLFSSTNYYAFPFTVNLKIELGYPGQTVIILPPIGRISAKTHLMPFILGIELRSVELSLLKSIVFTSPEGIELVLNEIKLSAKKIMVFYILKLMGIGLSGSVFALLFLGVRDGKRLMRAAVIGALTVLLIATSIFIGYDITGFERVEYEGMIEVAPWVLDLVWQSLDQIEELGTRVQVLATNLYTVLQQVENLGPVGLVDADVIVLHVSDIHNNPIAYSFAEQVIESFPVDFVMDTGDLTDWGTALEAEISERISGLDIPYLFVSGNHDSPHVLRKLGEIPNVIIVSAQMEHVHGLLISGEGDLVVNQPLPEPAPINDLKNFAEEIKVKWQGVEIKPDIFMIHNHRVAKNIPPGLFPVVVYGHSHIWGLEEIDGTVYINAGTTGAAGIRGFQSKEPLPYSLSLLYFQFDRERNLVLRAVDGVHVTGLGMGFSLERTFFDHSRNIQEDVEMIR